MPKPYRITFYLGTLRPLAHAYGPYQSFWRCKIRLTSIGSTIRQHRGWVGCRLSDAGRGIICHSTLAVTPERLPLGLFAQRNWVRDDEMFGTLPSHKKRPLEDKESVKWLDSVEALVAAREACPETTFVSVGDREADLFELFAMGRPAGVELLVRASWNRVVDSPHRYLWETLQTANVLGTIEVCAPRRPGEPIRQCKLSLRSLPITLKPPQARKRLGTVSLWGVLATETSPPKGEKAIEWLLLTTFPTPSVNDAIERVHWYTCRWTIEVWHRVLKTGCRIESRQLETADHLVVALTLYSIIAWRILYATMLARTPPMCHARSFSAPRNGKRCTATSTAYLNQRQLRRSWPRRFYGLQNWAVSLREKAMANPVRRCFGADSSTCPTSPTCF